MNTGENITPTTEFVTGANVDGLMGLLSLWHTTAEIILQCYFSSRKISNAFIQLIVDVINKRLDGIIRDMQEPETSLEVSEDEFEEIKRDWNKDNAIRRRLNQSRKLMNLPSWTARKISAEGHLSSTTPFIYINGVVDERGENWSESRREGLTNVLKLAVTKMV